jgi:glycosyltransferase involved in cell wall biosynthesis
MIVTDVGGNAEAVIHDETGLVVPPSNPAALAAAVLRLAQDPALRHKFGEAGRQRLVTHFTLETCVDGYRALYAELLDTLDERLDGETLKTRSQAAP